MKSKGILPTTYCPDCRARAGVVVDWKPPPGLDPRLRAFRCLSCRGVFYKVVNIRVGV